MEKEALMTDVEYFEYYDAHDQYISESVILTKEDIYARSKVTGQKRDLEGNILGYYNSKPLLDTRVYEV